MILIKFSSSAMSPGSSMLISGSTVPASKTLKEEKAEDASKSPMASAYTRIRYDPTLKFSIAIFPYPLTTFTG